MTNNNLITREFEGQEVGFRVDENGMSEVSVAEVSRFCGWTTIAKSGNETIRWARVNEKLEELGVAKVGNGDFIPEYIMYPLIGKANNERATRFMLWVGKVLVEIRQNGYYVSQSISEEQENNMDKYSTSKKIKNTFMNCSIEEIENEYKECMKTHRNKDGKDKTKIQKNIINILDERKELLISEGKSSFALIISEAIAFVKTKSMETNNKSRGMIISNKNKKIDKLEDKVVVLEEKVNYYEPKDDEYMVLNTHGISNNKLYETIKDDFGQSRVVKTKIYSNWIYYFPKHQLIKKEDLKIDWNKPIIVFLKFDCISSFDIQNLVKSAIDQVITRNYGEDDNIIYKVITERNKVVNKYKDGKIYICIKNV